MINFKQKFLYQGQILVLTESKNTVLFKNSYWDIRQNFQFFSDGN